MSKKESLTSELNSEQWALQWRLFDQIINTSNDQQAQLLKNIEQNHPTLYPELLKLMASHQSDSSILDEPIMGFDQTRIDSIPESIDGYQIIKPLGYGGLGDVYQACKDQDGFAHIVAIKMAPAGRYSDWILKSFKNELKMLLNLNHPNIERLFEGGVTAEKVPYLVVEYIDGLHIDEYCDQNQLNIKQRIELFIQVCEAVAALHQSLIIHRDIKPNNIMVDQQGTAKLLDFGLAKLLDNDPVKENEDATMSGYMMTLAYASPEQITNQNITTASDVYALGMVLHYLLCGRLPYQINDHDLAHASHQIVQKTPPLASQNIKKNAVINQVQNQLKSILKGELDAILSQAIHKEPDRRYSSAQQFADDLKNYLKHEPVSAKPDTVIYRMRKFIQRHTLGVITTAAVILSLLTLTLLLLNRSQQLQNALDAAQEEKLRVSQVTQFLVDVFKLSDPLENQAEVIAVKDLLDYSSQQLDRQFNQQPATKVKLYQTLAEVYINMSDIETSEKLLDQAKKIEVEHKPIDLLSGLLVETELLLHKGQHKEALALISAFDNSHPKLELPLILSTKKSLMNGELLYKLGELDQAIEVLQTADQKLMLDHQTNDKVQTELLQAGIHQMLGHVYWKKGDFPQVEAHYERSFNSNLAHLGPENNATLKSLSSLGILAYVQGRFELAKTRFTQVLNSRNEQLGSDHYLTADAHNRLGVTENELGHLKAAEKHFNEAIQGFEASGLAESVKFASVLNNLGLIKRQQTQYLIAERLFNRALNIQTRILGDDYLDLATQLNNLGLTSFDQGHFNKALKLFKQAHDFQLKATGTLNANIAFAMTNMGRVHLHLGQWEQSEVWINQAMQLRAEHLGMDHLLYADTLMAQAELAFVTKNFDQALKSAEQALNIRKKQLDQSNWKLADSRNLLRSINKEGIESHLPFCADAEIIKLRFGSNHPRTSRTNQRLKWLSYPPCYANQ